MTQIQGVSCRTAKKETSLILPSGTTQLNNKPDGSVMLCRAGREKNIFSCK
jgi:hypothetical protein